MVELTITMVILSVMALFTVTFLYQAAQIYVAVNERTESYEEGKFAIELMVREIREATSIAYPPQGTDNASQVTVAIARPSGSEIVNFRLSNGNIIRNDDQHPIASHVSNFIVSRTSSSDDDNFGSNKLTLELTFTTDDGHTISMEVVPNNLPDTASHPKKRFNKDWWEVVAR
ncbi:MAG: hypothetical protein JRG73_15815 [Deltaproteobacteria bacterium]|nr:hypothetical protein [Deltaproteobacteria bacterium]MBW2308392.1 hypothetical protein [Deltaproteobacteria bacterium]